MSVPALGHSLLLYQIVGWLCLIVNLSERSPVRYLVFAELVFSELVFDKVV
jgi:hypothetical protein